MSDSLLQDRPSRWVTRFAPLISEGETLDLACGGGRHARLLARLGHPVLAVDRDPEAVMAVAGERITALQFDLERDGADGDRHWPLQPTRYAGIVVTNYLHRPLMPALLASLAPGGVLIYETFAQGNGQFGKPSNPAFLLAPGELLRFAAALPDLRVIAFEDGYVADPAPSMVQRICCRRDAAVLPAGAYML
jgi:SAM-dependent methyltransferase